MFPLTYQRVLSVIGIPEDLVLSVCEFSGVRWWFPLPLEYAMDIMITTSWSPVFVANIDREMFRHRCMIRRYTPIHTPDHKQNELRNGYFDSMSVLRVENGTQRAVYVPSILAVAQLGEVQEHHIWHEALGGNLSSWFQVHFAALTKRTLQGLRSVRRGERVYILSRKRNSRITLRTNVKTECGGIEVKIEARE